MRMGLAMLFGVVAAVGCGDSQEKDTNAGNANGGNNGGASACSLELPLDGAVQATLSFGDAQGCGGATSGGLVTLTFGTFGGGASVQVGFVGLVFDQLGPVEAYVSYTDEGGSQWTAQDCSVDLTRNEVVETDPDFGDTYVLAGEGSCTDAAVVTAGDGDGEVQIGAFELSNDQVPGPD